MCRSVLSPSFVSRISPLAHHSPICIPLSVSQHLLKKPAASKMFSRVQCYTDHQYYVIALKSRNSSYVTIYLIFYSNQQLFNGGFFLCIAVSVHEYFTLAVFLEEVSKENSA